MAPAAFEIDLTDGPQQEREAAADDADQRTALQRMLQAKELLEAGLLTPDEFESKRRAILEDL